MVNKVKNKEGKEETLNKCCLYATLKMLWSSQPLRALISSSKTQMAEALKNLFDYLDRASIDPRGALSPDDYPVGKESEPYPWKEELTNSPFVIFVAKK